MKFRLLLQIFLLIWVTAEARGSRKRSRSLRTFAPYDVSGSLDQRWLSEMGRSSLRKQGQIPPNVPFPCFSPRSQIPPESVDRVRPGDIDVVAAMGDSLVAGNGAMEDYALGTFIESRGVSWAVGGDGDWRNFLTLPNILKVFNPKIKGFSVGKEPFLTPTTALNVAFPVSADQDALMQAKNLVLKMRNTRGVDYEKSWKLVTMFFGANDICSAQCYNKEDYSPRAHANKLMRALDYLQDNMPRAIVNLVPVIDVSASVRIKRSFMCRMLHRLFCSCFHRSGDVMSSITKVTRQYQIQEQKLIESGRYNKKSDYTVVIQPFMTFFNLPKNSTEKFKEAIDISYITHDCFHFSQKGHALAANLLWNNMLEPVGEKSRESVSYPLQRFFCPTDDNPYIFTYNNSQRFYQTGSQL
ncbi:phospholipase B1, membrane-associated-like [Cimex lectularius]|uniref:Phospholipase B1, membrane-associated n=1 Tax=Cimex lectularius TaxID=79782 RepID=A0A8I6SEE1_CIMLE|nr:phospholipase B1, membrane-associated-like [Cimex lectularius]